MAKTTGAKSKGADEAFEKYLADHVVVEALARVEGSIGVDLLRDAFFRGAHYAVTECAKTHKV